MTKEEVEGSDKWLNDPGPVTDADLEVSDDDFEKWQMSDVKPDELVDAEIRARYESYLLKHV
jgi:hypothetical protein